MTDEKLDLEEGTTVAPSELSEPEKPRSPARVVGKAIFQIISWTFVLALVVVVWPSQWGGPVTLTFVSGTSMEPTFHTGDLAVAVKSYSGYEVGEIIVYEVHDGDRTGMVIHRIIDQLPNGNYITQGDNKNFRDPWEIPEDWIRGKVITSFPQGAKYFLVIKSPYIWAVAFGLAITLALWPSSEKSEDDEDDPAEGGDPTEDPNGPADADDNGDADTRLADTSQ